MHFKLVIAGFGLHVISFFYMYIFTFPSTNCWGVLMWFWHCFKKLGGCSCGFLMESTVYNYWSMFLFLHQSHSDLVAMALQYYLSPRTVIPPTFVFGLRAELTSQGLWHLFMEFRVVYFWLCEECYWNFTPNLLITFSKATIFTILILLIHKHGRQIHFLIAVCWVFFFFFFYFSMGRILIYVSVPERVLDFTRAGYKHSK